jgi:hypothetical protein
VFLVKTREDYLTNGHHEIGMAHKGLNGTGINFGRIVERDKVSHFKEIA